MLREDDLDLIPPDGDGLAAVAPLAGLHHAALSVGDVDAARRWYGEVLGLEEIFRREWDTHTVVVMWFPGLRATLGLVEHTERGQGFSPANLGLDHLAFAVESGEQLWAWARRLSERGVFALGRSRRPSAGCSTSPTPTASPWPCSGNGRRDPES